MAYIYFQEGRWDKAVEEYKKLIALDPEDINTHNMLGDVYVKKGAAREAFEEYNKVSSDFTSRGQTDKAAIVNKKIAALDPALLTPEAQKKQNLIKQTLKAEVAMEEGDMETAIEALNEVLKLDSENLGAFYKLGELFEKKGQVQEAVKQYQMLGNAFLKNRLYKKAQELFAKVVALDPSSTEAHANLASLYVKQGSEGDAKKEYLNAAEQALSTGDLENANQYAAKAVELKSIEAHYVLGVVLYRRQQLSEAKTEFESLLRFKINHVGALIHLGKILLEQNSTDKAAENIQKALKIEKDNSMAQEAWVEVCLKKGNKAEAAATLKTLLERYIAKDQQAKIIETARSLISLDETNTAAYRQLAEALEKTGDKKAAADALFKLVLYFEKADKKDQVGDVVRKVLELDPSNSEAQKRLIGSVVAQAPAPAPAPAKPSPAVPQPPAGVIDLEQEIVKPPLAPVPTKPAPVPAAAPPVEKPKAAAVELDPQDELTDQLSIAENYIKQGMVEEAIEIYQQLSEAHPDHPEIRAKLNQAYTAYVKTGEGVIDALEAEKKAKEEEEKRLRAEMEKKAREEAEKQARAEIEKKAREEAEKKAREEIERKAREEAEKRIREETEKKIREETERKIREESDRKAKEAADRQSQEEVLRKAKEEIERKVREEFEQKARSEAERKSKEETDRKKASAAQDTATSRTPPPSKGDALEDNKDEFMTIAVADIYVRQQMYEEAVKIYRRILQMDPDNLEARKKLGDAENLLKAKTGAPSTTA
ncbi:MAG TPA: tetratricopeptide repeat protein, partial [bacterium]|nr:tetratricopeptide repeat protein [bacterium]